MRSLAAPSVKLSISVASPRSMREGRRNLTRTLPSASVRRPFLLAISHGRPSTWASATTGWSASLAPPSTLATLPTATTSSPGPYDLRVNSISLFSRGAWKRLTRNFRVSTGKSPCFSRTVSVYSPSAAPSGRRKSATPRPCSGWPLPRLSNWLFGPWTFDRPAALKTSSPAGPVTRYSS